MGGVRQVPEGSGEQGKMEKTGCKIICSAPTTLAVKRLMMMMLMTQPFNVNNAYTDTACRHRKGNLKLQSLTRRPQSARPAIVRAREVKQHVRHAAMSLCLGWRYLGQCCCVDQLTACRRLVEGVGAEQDHRCLAHLSVQLYHALDRRQGSYVVFSTVDRILYGGRPGLTAMNDSWVRSAFETV